MSQRITTTPTPEQGPRPLIWVAFGLPEAWVRQRLAPIGERNAPYLVAAGAPANLADPVAPEHAWDILVLGSYLNEQGLTLEAAVDRVGRARPSECILAVMPAPSSERALLLMRLGATDTVALDDGPERIEQAFERAVALAQARRAHADQEKLRILNQFAVTVNHEINNPLTGIMGTAELMLMDNKRLDDKSREDLKTIIKQCQRIREVTARLKTIQSLRTVPYGMHDQMLDLMGETIVASPATTPSREQQFLPTPRILVVDDNPLIIDLIGRLFDQRYTIDAAACASDALGMIERSAYDLVLIDLILPEMNGLELFRAIRRVRPRQRAMLTTAYQGDARVEQAIAEGAAGCIYKPFQLEELEQALDEALKAKG